MSAKPIPDGYPAITPYLIVEDAARAIDFYKDIFGATERMRMPAANGRIGHAELTIGGSVLMLSDPCPEMKAFAPVPGATAPMSLYLYVPDVDATVARALAAGATLTHPVETKFYGDRSGTVTDPWGHVWSIATRLEDISPAELKRRFEELYAD